MVNYPPVQTTMNVHIPLQARVLPWVLTTMTFAETANKTERLDRFAEESLEYLQSLDYSKARAHAMVDYVFDREAGDPFQECGGVLITLAASCIAHDIDMEKAGEDELARIWQKVEKIREKQKAKPRGDTLMEAYGGKTGDDISDDLHAILTIVSRENSATAREVGVRLKRTLEKLGWPQE